MLKLRQIDFIPAISPNHDRGQFALFTPGYLFVDRVVIAPKRSADITDLSLLRGKRVGMVHGSLDKDLLTHIGAHPVEVNNDKPLAGAAGHGRCRLRDGYPAIRQQTGERALSGGLCRQRLAPAGRHGHAQRSHAAADPHQGALFDTAGGAQ